MAAGYRLLAEAAAGCPLVEVAGFLFVEAACFLFVVAACFPSMEQAAGYYLWVGKAAGFGPFVVEVPAGHLSDAAAAVQVLFAFFSCLHYPAFSN